MTIKRKNIFFKFLIVCITYLFIEIICFATIQLGYIPAKKANFHFVAKNPKYPLPMADINETWGTWHYKENFRSQNGCIYFDYAINSYGARDKERKQNSTDSNRVIVLGDSFLEGWGIDENKRLSTLLEKETGHEFLNFSCADFGTTQEYLVYKYLAASFSHSTIFIGFLPFNDFENDDKAYWEKQKRYRPFFVKSDSAYQLIYDKPSIKESELNKEFYKSQSNSFKETLARFLRSFTYWFNIVDYIKNARNQKKFFSFKNNKVVSYYYDYTPEQIEKFKFVLSKIREAAPAKRIILCSIPVIPDILRRKEDGKPPLPDELNNISKSMNIEYVDLLPYFAEKTDYRNYFFFCDTHWNENANTYVSKILLPLFNKQATEGTKEY